MTIVDGTIIYTLAWIAYGVLSYKHDPKAYHWPWPIFLFFGLIPLVAMWQVTLKELNK